LASRAELGSVASAARKGRSEISNGKVFWGQIIRSVAD
jgi:hypothetical protein